MEQRKKFPVLGWIGIGLGAVFLLVCGISTLAVALSEPENKAADAVVVDNGGTCTFSDGAVVQGGTSCPSVTEPVTKQPTPDDPEPTTAAPTKPPAPVKPIIEDGLYHVGEDIPAGTYRLAEPVGSDDFCYWRKSKDAEGEDIIDNDLASTGRLQVTVKKGQWFETSRCGTWVKK